MDQASASVTKAPKGLAISSLVCGLLFCVPLVGQAALVLGIMALSKKGQGGRGMAIAGTVLGAVGTIFAIILIATSLNRISNTRARSSGSASLPINGRPAKPSPPVQPPKPVVPEIRICAHSGLIALTEPAESAEPAMGDFVGVKREARLYVLEHRDGWVRFRLTPEDKGLAAWLPETQILTLAQWKAEEAKRAAEVAKQAEAQARAKLEQDVQFLKDKGVLKRFNPEMNEAFIEPLIWNGLEINVKENISRTLATYCGKTKGRSEWVEIKDAYSGKRLAKYGAWGFKVD